MYLLFLIFIKNDEMANTFHGTKHMIKQRRGVYSAIWFVIGGKKKKDCVKVNNYSSVRKGHELLKDLTSASTLLMP